MAKFFDTTLVRIIAIVFLVLCIVGGGAQFAEVHGAQSSVSVPTIMGDYCNKGVRTSSGQTDIPKLLSALKAINAKDYMHLVWTEQNYPKAWSDFQAMAPEFQKANINLWLYITPPSEGVPEPFGGDYVKWGIECAKIAKQFSVIKGIVIDDFNANVSVFTPSYCKNMMTEARKIAPQLSLLVVSYYGREKTITKHIEQGAIDGVIFPYFSRPVNHHNSSQLSSQILSYRKNLDQTTNKLKIRKKIPLIVMVYATKLSSSPDSPTPTYVKECLDIALASIRGGLAQGVVTYCLPKDKPEFLLPVASAFENL